MKNTIMDKLRRRDFNNPDTLKMHDYERDAAKLMLSHMDDFKVDIRFSLHPNDEDFAWTHEMVLSFQKDGVDMRLCFHKHITAGIFRCSFELNCHTLYGYAHGHTGDFWEFAKRFHGEMCNRHLGPAVAKVRKEYEEKRKRDLNWKPAKSVDEMIAEPNYDKGLMTFVKDMA